MQKVSKCKERVTIDQIKVYMTVKITLICAHTTYVSDQFGVSLSYNKEKVKKQSKYKERDEKFVFNWQQNLKMQKLKGFSEHCNEYGENSDGPGEGFESSCNCFPAYSPNQVSQCIVQTVTEDPNTSAKRIYELICAKKPTTDSLPSLTSVPFDESSGQCSVKRSTCPVESAALNGYFDILNTYGFVVEVFRLIYEEMKETWLKEAENIFDQCQKAGSMHNEAVF